MITKSKVKIDHENNTVTIKGDYTKYYREKVRSLSLACPIHYVDASVIEIDSQKVVFQVSEESVIYDISSLSGDFSAKLIYP